MKRKGLSLSGKSLPTKEQTKAFEELETSPAK